MNEQQADQMIALLALIARAVIDPVSRKEPVIGSQLEQQLNAILSGKSSRNSNRNW